MAGEERLVNPAKTVLEPPHDPDDDVPEEFAGLSKAQLARNYSELQKKLGEQGQELGTLRAHYQQSQQQQVSNEGEDFFERFHEDPEAAVSSLIERKVLPLRSESFEQRLDREFEGWRDVAQSSEFAAWVNKSPVRGDLYRRAHGQADYDAASELLTNFRASQGASPQETPEAAVKRDRELRGAITESGAARRPKGRIYSRAWIRDLQIRDPARYRAEMPEIMAAYEQGRVTD